jgi:hypothetical protein
MMQTLAEEVELALPLVYKIHMMHALLEEEELQIMPTLADEEEL